MESLKPERIHEMTNGLWHLLAVGRADTNDVVKYIEREGLDDVVQLYAMWLGLSVGLFNLMSPVEYGHKLSPEQVQSIHHLVYRMGSSWLHFDDLSGVQEVQRAFTHLSEDDTEAVGADFILTWATAPATTAQMLVLSSAVVRSAARFHGVPVATLATRANELRMYLVDIRAHIQNTHWCGECLPKALAVLEMTDDRQASRATPDNDMSFLSGIDLTKEAPTDE